MNTMDATRDASNDASAIRKLIENKLSDNDVALRDRLGGVDCFTKQMVSNKLIAASCNNIDDIMREFMSKLLNPSSSRSVMIINYDTFIKALRDSKMGDMADNLEINWSAPHTESSYCFDPLQPVDSALQSQSDNTAKDKDSLIQPNSSLSSADRPRSSWATQRNISVDQQKLVASSQFIQAGDVDDQNDKEKAENIPGDEIPTGLVLHLKNGLQEPILLKMEPAIKKYQLTLAEMRNLILNEAIPCNFSIITFFDLHSSRKSTLICDFLDKVTYTIERSSTFKYTCNERGLSVYNATLLKQYPNNGKYLWFAPTKALKEAVSCGSAILRMSLHYGYKLQVDAPNDVFKDQILDSYLECVCSNLKEVIQGSHELQQILSSAAIHINIIDNDTGKGAREFLSLISHHLSSNLHITWLKMDDIKELNTPLIHRQKRQRQAVVEMKIRSIIYAAEVHSQTSEIPVTFIIMCSKDDTISERDKAKDTLLKAINNEIKRLSLPLQQPAVLVLDPSSSDDMTELNHELDKIVNAQCLAKKHIKLSWLFLHSAVLSPVNDINRNVVISYKKLKSIAEKIGIRDKEYDKFLETFTNFLSILYFPAFKPLQNVVILRPVEFINKLSTLFEMPKGFNGIYNMEQLNEKIPNTELANAIVNALCSLGLALKTTAEKVDTRTSSLANPRTPLVFIPLARGDTSHMHVEKSSIASLFILFNTEINLPIPDCLSFFASELLTLKGASLLTDEISKPNIFKILLHITRHDYIVTFMFQGTCIEVIMENYVGRGDGVLGKILQSCKDALDRMSSVPIKFTYKLALECLDQAQVSTAGYIDPPKKGFEFLPNKKLCHNCEVSANLLRKKWREVIQKMYDKEVKERDRIKFDKLLDLAHDLGHVIKSSQSLKILADQLGITVEREFLTVLSQSCLPWQRVFTIFLLWEKKEEPTKEKLKSALKRLGQPTNILD